MHLPRRPTIRDGDVYSLACGKPDDETDFTCEEAEGSGDHTNAHEVQSVVIDVGG